MVCKTYEHGSGAGCSLVDCGNCDSVARMWRVMNVLLMQFVITRAIRGWLVKHRHIGPAVMYEPTRQKAFVILWWKMRKTAKAEWMWNGTVDWTRQCEANLQTFSHQILSHLKSMLRWKEGFKWTSHAVTSLQFFPLPERITSTTLFWFVLWIKWYIIL